MKIIDLSRTFNENMTVYPGSEPPLVEQVATVKQNGYAMKRLDFTNHTGTHLDVQGQMIDNGKLILDYQLEKFFGRGVVIDCRKSNIIEKDDLLNKIEGYEVVLFYSGHENLYETEDYFYNYPVLSNEAIDYLIECDVKSVGVDCNSIDEIDSSDFNIHKRILGHDIVIYENLCNLSELLNAEFDFFGFPLPIEGDGVPVRALAMVRNK